MWLSFALATTLMWGLAELFYKKGAQETETYAHLKTCIFVGICMGLHAGFTLLVEDVGYDWTNLWRYLPVSACYILSMALSFFGMRFIEESISDPIENTSGALCTLLCVLILGDRVSAPTWICIGIIVAGILGIGFLEHRDESHRSSRLGKTMAAVAFCMPFCYAVLDALGSFLDVYYLEDVAATPLAGVTEENIEEVANISYELTFAFAALLLFLFIKIKKVPLEIPKQGNKIMAAVCETAGQFTYVYAMRGNGAVAAPLISSVCVVSLILCRIFLKEKLTWKQYVFIALVIAGILGLAIVEGE